MPFEAHEVLKPVSTRVTHKGSLLRMVLPVAIQLSCLVKRIPALFALKGMRLCPGLVLLRKVSPALGQTLERFHALVTPWLSIGTNGQLAFS